MTQTILVIDDSKPIQALIKCLLAAEQMTAHGAFDGQSGIDQAAALRPDLILLDVDMPPGIDGFETCRRLKANIDTAQIPVIFLTARAAEEDKGLGLSLGAIDYLTKPVKLAELIPAVRAALNGELVG